MENFGNTNLHLIGIYCKIWPVKRKTLNFKINKGTIISVQAGAVNGIVKIAIDGIVLSCTISMSAIADLELAAGKEAI